MTDKDFKADIFAKTSAEWAAVNPFLAKNDLGIEVDTGKFKVGEGTKWADTAYVATDPAAIAWSSVTSKPALATFVAVPSAANDPGTAGQMAYDGTHLYICTATDTWLRVGIATWP
jgi:hypothetical protein